MIERINQARRNEKGFTLIELLIVIIVLGILAAIVVFAVGNTRKDALAASCKTTKTSVELSAEAVKTTTGVYPTGTFSTAPNALVAPAPGAMLKSWPTSSEYTLQYRPVGGDYTVDVLVADGPDAGTDPDVSSCDALA